MKIFIPSYKRAGRVKTRKVLGGGGTLIVSDFEKDEYKDKEGGDIIPIPDKVQGSIGRVRNWILENSEDEEIFMIDDDISEIGYHENMKSNEMKPEQIFRFFENGFEMCREIGTVLWGINLQVDPKFYREYQPFSLLSPILGPLCGHIRSVLKYDENLSMKEDYDFFLQVIARYRKTLRFNKYYYMAGHIDESGGCTSSRTKEEEERLVDEMEKKWGKRVVRFDLKKSINPRVRVPISGV